MAEDDPLGRRAFARSQNPMEQINQMLEDMKKGMPNFMQKIRIELDVSPDEGIQILGLLKDLRK